MPTRSTDSAVTISLKELERIIRHAVHEEITRVLRRQPHIFYLEPETPLYEDMAAIVKDSKRQKVKVYSRKEAFGG